MSKTFMKTGGVDYTNAFKGTKREPFPVRSESAGSVHDYENAIRKGRAWYVCPKCRKDISLEYVMYMDAVQRVETMGGTVTPNDNHEAEEPREKL